MWRIQSPSPENSRDSQYVALPLTSNTDPEIVQVILRHNSQDVAGRLATMNETARDLANYLTNPNNSIAVIPYQDNMGTFNNLMTLRFTSTEDAMLFYDRLKLSKGPMIGTTFTVAFPCAAVGDISENVVGAKIEDTKFVRINIGLEPLSELKRVFDEALSGDTDLVAQEGVQKKKRNNRNKNKNRRINKKMEREQGQWFID